MIDANKYYYPIDRVPEFWEWLIFQGDEGKIKVPIEIFEEILAGSDELVYWIKDDLTKNALLLNEDVSPSNVAKVVSEGYASDLTDVEIEKLGRDPFLLAYGLVDKNHRVIVTTEASKSSKLRANKHIPDVARFFNIRSVNTFQLTRELDFRTNWNSNSP